MEPDWDTKLSDHFEITGDTEKTPKAIAAVPDGNPVI